MGIEFKARVLLELGAELISSDGVAIYELVKNTIDAKSPTVEISIRIILQHSSYLELSSYLANIDSNGFDTDSFIRKVSQRIESDAPEISRSNFFQTLGNPLSKLAAIKALDQAYFEENYICIKDYGHGMNLDTLQSGYLTIGTPMRLLQKVRSTKPNWTPKNQSEEQSIPALGEKGIGRLAAMRLGHYVHVQTVKEDIKEKNWHILELDWRPIFSDPTLNASALDYKPEVGLPKESPNDHGTILTIRCLQSDWDESKLKQLANSELAKLADPFLSDFMANFLTLRLQGQKVLLAEFEHSKLKHADAICRAKLQRVESWDKTDPLDGLEFVVDIDYKHYKGAKRIWHIRSEHLASCIREPVGRRKKAKAFELQQDSDAVISAIPQLGPFEMQFYWFNRGRLMREEHDLWTQMQDFVKAWSGGLLVFRDGFRVYPYGAATDDWLDLDRSALSGSAYKLNRAQIIGYLRISHNGNPLLLDQTNREGFRDCPEKEALRRLLRHTIITKCKLFLEDTLKENKGESAEALDSLERRVGISELQAVTQLQRLQSRIPEESESINEILFQIGEIRDAWERAKITIKNHESDLEQYIHLAGVGLQVEFIAHELSRVTGDALQSLREGDALTNEATRLGLETQLKTLEKRIRVVDLLSIPGRQRKTVVNIEDIVQTLVEMHDAKIKRHGLNVRINKTSNKPCPAKVEEGQILQILDNLFSNSFYWLSNRFDRSVPPEILISIDPTERLLTFSDNGPGVPNDMAEDIFKPFVTTKPPGDGRGLGLFISRRLAEYNDATLDVTLAAEDNIHHGFVLSLKNVKKS
ncbi:MAG: ATP-binding protein [Methylobacter tundripaludum]|nr:ATP-binding protein [Methylobacter tundripaludum]